MHFTGGDWLELPTSEIQLQEKLGEGAFGVAFKGLVRANGQWQRCAVKKLKGNELMETCKLPNSLLSLPAA